MFCLDYTACGPSGEPRVVYVDQEDDYHVVEIAPDFETFVRGLISEEAFDEGPPVDSSQAGYEALWPPTDGGEGDDG